MSSGNVSLWYSSWLFSYGGWHSSGSGRYYVDRSTLGSARIM